jgi:hypothetical protein
LSAGAPHVGFPLAVPGWMAMMLTARGHAGPRT